MSEPSGDNHQPSEIRLAKSKDLLTLSYSDGDIGALTAEFLRVFSPSAEVQGHSEAERVLQWGKSGVIITDIEPVGNYAIRIVFSDGHNTGFYSWVYLHDLVKNKDDLWAGYLAELEAAGRTR